MSPQEALQKHGAIHPSQDVAMLQLHLKQKQSNRIKIREIKPTKTHTSKKLPKLILVFDTEANIEDLERGKQRQTLNFGYGLFTRYYPEGRIYESDYLKFEDAQQFYNLIEHYSKQGTKLYCVAHNIGYDWSIIGINPIMIANGWGTNGIQDQRGNTVIKYTREAHTVIFIDSMNFFKTSLGELAKAFGLEKGSVDFRTSDKHTIEEYCKNDVFILNEVMREWRALLEKENFGAFKPTIASQALAILKQLYLKEPIKTNQGLNQKLLERRAYYGGRTEANFIGYYWGKVWNLDINSAYPSVMVGNKFPVEFERELQNPNIDDIRRIDDKQCCFAEVDIETDKAFYPARQGKRLIFPIGRFTTWLCEPELRVAIENKHVRKIKRLFVYRSRPIFTQYVNDLYRKRRHAISNGNTALALCYKYLLNSLYGKFGEFRKEWEPKRVSNKLEDGVEWQINLNDRTIYKTISFSGLEYEYTQKEGATHSFPLISAFVTSYLRVKMLNAMARVGKREWIYCDSDSLYVTDRGRLLMADLISDTALGKWKIEKIGINMDIRGLKDYVFADAEKCKGIPKGSKQLEDGVYEVQQWQTMHKTICENLHGSVTIEPIIKKLERVYHKGNIDAEGWVHPLELNEFT